MKTLTQRYGTVGWEEFLQTKKDILKPYDSTKAKTKNRPVQTEPGIAAESSFREWLIKFLPEKYGVTSGYIIPDSRALKYSLKHFDVIIYDKLKSPILWVEETLDNSSIGKRRAIPSKFVKSVFEIKSSLNRKSIEEAIDKLKQLNNYSGILTPNFTSAIIFFEVKTDVQHSCVLAEKLFSNDIIGYYGGIVLRAQNMDENLAGYFQFIEFDKTESQMPFVKNIDGLKLDDQNNPILNEKGEMFTIISLENRWNFEVGYSPCVKNVSLNWSYNSFPNFAFDLLDRLDGTFDPKNRNIKMFYGLSFFRG